jgi:ferredoxin-type protein NapH
VNRGHPGRRATAEKGRLRAHKWLLLRRLSQLGVLTLFLLGPLAAVWIVQGNLASSLVLGVVPLTDPYVALQSLAAGHVPLAAGLIGAGILVAFYALAGRVYCSWVCPVNMVTDAAAWLRARLRLPAQRAPAEALRYWLLAGTLAGSYVTGTLLWEWVNPVSMLHRGLIFGFGLGWAVVLGVFLFDLAVARRGWCGHVCPMGAFYGALGRYALLRVSAMARARCDQCMDCYALCPEPRVITPALTGSPAASPLVLSPACTNCGRCIDVCSKDVFRFTTRFDHRSEPL